MKQVRKQIIPLLSLTLMMFLSFGGTVQATTTTASTAGNAVYVAGNPDMYPIEYYDEDTESYEGILPEIYEQIAAEQEIDICYVSGGINNQQQRLAKNNQIEVVSAYYKGDVTAISEEYEWLSFEVDGKEYCVCIGFTEIADGNVRGWIKQGLNDFSQEQWIKIALTETVNHPSDKYTPLLVGLIVILAVICILCLCFLLKHRKKDRKQRENAHIDPLTGMGNELYFEYCYKNHITVNTYGLYYIAYIGTDFKKMEQYLGLDKANEIQRFGADILTTYTADTDFAARIADGVYALAFQGVSDEQAKQRIGELITQLNGYVDRFMIEYHVPFFGGLFGMTSPTITCEMAVYNARQGYHYASASGEHVCLCDTEFLSKEASRARLLRKLNDAVAKQHFSLNLQFVVDAKNGYICGAEALSRWVDPEDGVQLPAVYIEAMTNAGLIDRLDFHMLEQVCQKLESWKGTAYDGLYLSCNFARPTISSANFFERFMEIINRYSFEHHNLVLEMTEDSLAENQAMVFQNIQACKKEGFLVALDDLGSGYTSFRDLCDYPIDIVKIDRSIVAKSVTERGRALLKGIVKLARDLEIKVLCEGVESSEENEAVKAAGCNFVQGYYYSRVIPEEHSGDFLRKRVQ